MKVIKADLPRTLDRIELHLFSDLHIGDKYCDYPRIIEHINEVRSKENAYCILNGDIINNATTASVSDSYAEQMTPMEQIAKFTEVFEPVKDKIIGITSGNHENRTYRDDGVDITELCARQLGLADKYAKNGMLLFVRFGQTTEHNSRPMCYTVYCTHGSGGGRKEGGKINHLADLTSIVDSDIYIHGHTHLPAIMKEGFFRTDVHSSTVFHVDKLFVNTSAALNYGGYGEAFQFKPSSTDCPVIYLEGGRKKFYAML